MFYKNRRKTICIFYDVTQNFQKVNFNFFSILSFSFPGNESGTWYVDLKTGPAGSCGTGNPAVKPDVTMSMNDEVFQQMFSGEIFSRQVFFSNSLNQFRRRLLFWITIWTIIPRSKIKLGSVAPKEGSEFRRPEDRKTSPFVVQNLNALTFNTRILSMVFEWLSIIIWIANIQQPNMI